jgi:hypothetical protein
MVPLSRVEIVKFLAAVGKAKKVYNPSLDNEAKI